MNRFLTFFSNSGQWLIERPRRLLLSFIALSMVLWTLQCSLLQNIQGVDALETVIWGAQWTMGHAKHPPLSGWIGYLFTLLSRRADWGLYLASQCCLALGVWFTCRTLRLFWNEASAVLAALLLYFLYYYTPSWMKFSTYFVEMALTPIAVYSFFSALKSRKIFRWLIFGVLCGLGMLNKYSFALQLLGMGIIFFSDREWRKQLTTPGPWLAAAAGVLIFSPHLLWLIRHDFVCFQHIGNRLSTKPNPFLPLLVPVTVLYPLAMSAAVLVLARLRGWKQAARKEIDKPVLRWTLILTLTPAVLYFALALCGEDLIMMWFCTTFSWTGAAVLAAFPFAVDRPMLRRSGGLLLLFIAILFFATSLDLILSPRPRLHTDPAEITRPAEEFWQKQCGRKLELVYGDRWYIGVLANYSEAHPAACELGDPVFWESFGPRIMEEGALLIGDYDDFAVMEKELGSPAGERQKVIYRFRSLSGREKSREVLIARFPSRAEREAARQR